MNTHYVFILGKDLYLWHGTYCQEEKAGYKTGSPMQVHPHKMAA